MSMNNHYLSVCLFISTVNKNHDLRKNSTFCTSYMIYSKFQFILQVLKHVLIVAMEVYYYKYLKDVISKPWTNIIVNGNDI